MDPWSEPTFSAARPGDRVTVYSGDVVIWTGTIEEPQ